MYKLFKDVVTNEITRIIKDDGVTIFYIPLVDDNVDYQEYLKWLAEGNEPLPADE